MRYKTGNVLEATEFYIAHGANAKGVMGSGVAKAVREKWPVCYEEYRDACLGEDGLPVGDITYYTVEDQDDNPVHVIINLITQADFGTNKRQVNYAAIAYGFAYFFDSFLYDSAEVAEIAIPRIGAGLGGGDWNIISAILEDLEAEYPVEFVVYDL